MATTTTKRVRPMTELCHDTLAEGVLEVHGGLPESWVEMFKANPRAWEQLTNAVVQQPRTPQSDLHLAGENPLVSVTVLTHSDRPLMEGEDGIPTDVETANVWLRDMPEWFAVLLDAYYESNQRSRATGQFTAATLDSNECMKIFLYSADGVAGLWENVVDIYRIDTILYPAMVKLFDAWNVDLHEQLADEIDEAAEEGAEREFLEEADDATLVEYFEDRCQDLLRDMIVSHVEALAFEHSRGERRLFGGPKPVTHATYEKVPQLSLAFDFTTGLW